MKMKADSVLNIFYCIKLYFNLMAFGLSLFFPCFFAGWRVIK